MKKLILFVFLISAQFSSAQMPHAFKYHGLARSHNFEVLVETPISLIASILTGNANGQEVYRELHHVNTNATGLFSLAIGQGNVQSGSFDNIQWSDGLFYLKVEIDVDDSGQFEYAGTSPLLAVPYAMHAYTAENVDDADADPFNEIQTLDFDSTSNTLSISGGNSIRLPNIGHDADYDPLNKVQTLDFDATANTLSISGGNSITLPYIGPDADSDPFNEIQTLDFNATDNTLSISGGNTINLPQVPEDADSDPFNEIQTLSFNPSTNKLKISDGNEIQLPNDLDKDPRNELQELSVFKQFKPLAPLSLRISQGNSIDLPVTSVWNFSTKDNNISHISTTAPVTTKKLTTELLEVTPTPAQWDYPQMTPKEYQFRTALGTTGMRLSKNRLAFHYASDLSKYSMYMDGKSLRYYNNTGWVTSEVGGNQSGVLKIYSGTSSYPYFTVEKIAQDRPRVTLSSIKSKNIIFTLSEADNSSYSSWYGNGSASVIVTASGTKPGHGAIYVADAKSTTKAGIHIDASGRGVLFADIKNFVTDHPTEPGKEIVYASLEGPEAAIYKRGTTRLINGEATIEFPKHFSVMLARQDMTVVLTPLSAESKGLAVIEKNVNGIKVKELHQSKGNYEFDWEVKGVRKGYEDFEVVRDKNQVLLNQHSH